MGSTVADARVNTSIFRKDWSQVIAIRRELAVIQPVTLKLDATGYKAGEVLSRNSVSGDYEKYSSASGTYGAAAVLGEDVSGDDQPTAGHALARAIFSGYVFKDALVGSSAGALTDLGAHTIIGADGVSIIKF